MIKQISLVALCSLLFACSSSNEKAKDAKKDEAIAVDVFVVSPSDVPLQIQIPGSIIPAEEVQMYSEVSGKIQQILFAEGKKVQKGELLLKVDSDILNAQRNELKVNLDLAKKDEARKKALLDANGLSIEEYEKSASALAAIQTQIDVINVQISKSEMRAPFSGRVGLRHISEGAYITPSTLITSIVKDDFVKVEFAISETYASAVKMGQEVQFKQENDSTIYTGKVFAYEPYINANTRMLTIRAELKNDGNLMPGAFVSVNYDLGATTNAMMVPTESVIPILKGQKIWVIRNGLVTGIPVELGIRNATQVQVKGAIKTGDSVLISGLLAVKEGMPATIKSTSK